MSPESIVSTGFSEASKKPRCTVAGDALSSWIFSALCASAPARRKATLKQIPKLRDLMVSLPRDRGPPISGLKMAPITRDYRDTLNPRRHGMLKKILALCALAAV